MSNKFKVRVTDPVRDGGLGASEKVVEDGYFMAKEHEAIHKMGTHKTSTASDEDALPLSGGQQLDGRVVRDGRIGNGVSGGVVCRADTKGLGFLALVPGDRAGLGVNLIVRPEVERTESVDLDLGVESKGVEPDFSEWLTSAVHGSSDGRSERGRGQALDLTAVPVL